MADLFAGSSGPATGVERVTQALGKGRIAIFFWEGWLGVAPSLINGIRELVRAGYRVDVIMRSTSQAYAAAPAFPEDVRLLTHVASDPPTSSVSFAGDSPPANGVKRRRALSSSLSRPVAELLRFLAFGRQCIRNHEYACFIGVDMRGLITATAHSLLGAVPVLYWSLETKFLADFTDPVMRTLKRLDRVCSRRALYTIIQDAARANSLMSENGISPAQIVLVPNSPLGPAPKVESAFFQQKFGLPGNARVVLQIGMIDSAVLSLEVAQAAKRWPHDWALIFHERAKRSLSDPYIKQIRDVGNGNLYLSLDPVPYDDLDGVVASGHIGLVFYRRELGPNVAQIVGASGKLGHYLRCGLPVVCLDLPGFPEVIERYACGICVRTVDEIRDAAQRILDNYAFYSANAVRCYEEVFEFGAYFSRVLEHIDEIRLRREGGVPVAAGQFFKDGNGRTRGADQAQGRGM